MYCPMKLGITHIYLTHHSISLYYLHLSYHKNWRMPPGAWRPNARAASLRLGDASEQRRAAAAAAGAAAVAAAEVGALRGPQRAQALGTMDLPGGFLADTSCKRWQKELENP